MKIIYTKIFYNEINPEENFPDYGILKDAIKDCGFQIFVQTFT